MIGALIVCALCLLFVLAAWLFTEAKMPYVAPPPLSPEDREARYEEWR